MAAKSSIRDTGRVLDLSLSEVDRISKLVPNMKLDEIFSKNESDLKAELRTDEFSRVSELKNIYNSNDLSSKTLEQATLLEGSLRNTGIHACGVIITPSDISEFVPITKAKDSDYYVTQFDNSVVEDAGLLKMDFLGLKTLTIIKDTVKLIKYKYNTDLDPEKFPLDDNKTYELFQKGETVGVFQYESLGMQKYLKDLKPNEFNDLIAMNALYRPGPLEYIPSYISRKSGLEPISYDLPEMEEFLKETYGITVYQEQVMSLSQKISNFTKGEADLLRKAMGKKIFSLIEKLKPKFMKGGQNNGYNVEILEKIWKDWEAFASYAFNKSHSTCYAWIAYQTAYLKANYPAEYMAAVLSNNMNDIKQVSFFMEECRRMGILVLGPDVNESFYKFTVNNQGAIRFGMGAVKGVGRGAVETIVAHRQEKPYKSIFTRILSNDDLFKHLSTFAVEISEFRTILNHADEDSLVLGDELCSGTEVGSAKTIFTAGLNWLSKRNICHIFATHYHELAHLLEAKPGVCNMHLQIDTSGTDLLFEYRYIKGKAEKSYGIQVAKLAGLPAHVLEAATNYLNSFEASGARKLQEQLQLFN